MLVNRYGVSFMIFVLLVCLAKSEVLRQITNYRELVLKIL